MKKVHFILIIFFLIMILEELGGLQVVTSKGTPLLLDIFKKLCLSIQGRDQWGIWQNRNSLFSFIFSNISHFGRMEETLNR